MSEQPTPPETPPSDDTRVEYDESGYGEMVPLPEKSPPVRPGEENTG